MTGKRNGGVWIGRLDLQVILCGLKKLEKGGARISEKHANFIVNPKGAGTAADIEWLILEVQRRVEEETQTRLVPEVKIVGDPL